MADITYIPTSCGFLSVAIALDVWSRRIVDWAMESYLRTELVLKALDSPSLCLLPAMATPRSVQALRPVGHRFEST